MTDNIKPTVQEKTAWAKVSQEFNDWWNSDYSDESNPFRFNSAAYWAWAGWSEAVRLNAQADIRALIADDAYAMTFQSLGQYRSALLAALSAAPQPAQQPIGEKDALLRQALDALENGVRVRNAEGGTKYQPPIEEAAIEAIRNHLGVKND